MSDPVAEKFAFLKMYMSSQPDTLVGYAKWYGKVTEPIATAEMSAIDTKSMTLTCTLKDGSKKVAVVAIDPPLAGYDDVKPRLLEMKAISQEGLGMIKPPQITSFQLPLRGLGLSTFLWVVIPYGGFVSELAPAGSSLLIPAQHLHAHISSRSFKIGLLIMVGLHVLEGLYTLHLCRKHKASFSTTFAYFVSTLIFGMPIWKGLRKRIQDERIQSVMKIE